MLMADPTATAPGIGNLLTPAPMAPHPIELSMLIARILALERAVLALVYSLCRWIPLSPEVKNQA
jgi:hypothetical protein